MAQKYKCVSEEARFHPRACRFSLVALCYCQSWSNRKQIQQWWACIVSVPTLSGQILFTKYFTLIFLLRYSILFLDSMTKSVHRHSYYTLFICKWLNFLGVGPPCFDSLPLILPKVPKQRGHCDCGVFVCRYAYSLFQMRHWNFNYYSEKSTFKTSIAMDPAFQFKQSDMESFRNEIATLIGNLSKIYLMSDEIKCTK